jgi:hypothetical protein
MTIYKYPFEQFVISIDFAADLGAGGAIASISGVTAVNDLTKADSTEEVIATEPAPAISGTAVTFTVAGGVAGETHTVSVQIVSTQEEQYQGEITLRIQE